MGHFRATPRPDEEVIALFERALRAAKSGRVRAANVVLVTHLKVETASAGEMRRIDSLLAGLARSTHELLTQSDQVHEDPDMT